MVVLGGEGVRWRCVDLDGEGRRPWGGSWVWSIDETAGELPTAAAAACSSHAPEPRVMVKRQRTAFPPNFVHSLDGSHMMMTAVACKKQGLNFAGVHDSYWTHACDVDTMNKILREKFVELYDTPILENVCISYPSF
nr:unnamed protein product [Digitaria exilis]